MHNLLCLESKHCCVAGDLYPILEQYVPPRDSLCRKDNLSQHCLFRAGEGDGANRARLDGAERRTAVLGGLIEVQGPEDGGRHLGGGGRI
jgi:hypothetical protein